MNQTVFDISYKNYDSWFDNEGKTIFENELAGIKLLVDDTKPLSVEIGSGTGRFAERLNIDVGIEPSFNMAKLAKRRGVKTIIGEGENLPVKNKTFERAFFIFSVCFLNSIEKSFQESYRILKDNGEIIIGFIPSESPLGKNYIQKKKRGHPYYKNSTFFSYTELKEILEKVGFTVVQTVYQMLKDEQRAENPAHGLSKSANFLIIKGQKFEPNKSKID